MVDVTNVKNIPNNIECNKVDNWIMPLDHFDIDNCKPKVTPNINPNCLLIVPEFYGETLGYKIYLKFYYSWVIHSCGLVAYIDGQYFGIEQLNGKWQRSVEPLQYLQKESCLFCEHND